MGADNDLHVCKCVQCLNITAPLGQGLWEGVRLSDVLQEVGEMNNVRRINYWGFHNAEEGQIFRSSVSYTEAMEPVRALTMSTIFLDNVIRTL